MLQSKEQIGKLDRRITFQEMIIGDDVSNADVETGWQDIETTPEVWANVDERSGTEEFKADQLNGVKLTNFTIRYRNDLNTKLRIVYGSDIYDIQTILPLDRNRFLKIVATAGLTTYQETDT